MKRSDLIRLIAEEVQNVLTEKELTDKQMKKREKYAKAMKSDIPDFKRNYGDHWKEVMYATANKEAKKKGKTKSENVNERSLTDPEQEKREKVVKKDMKPQASYFKSKYGKDWKHVMYAVATDIAKGKKVGGNKK